MVKKAVLEQWVQLDMLGLGEILVTLDILVQLETLDILVIWALQGHMVILAILEDWV
jgi:hypothetical protein